MRNFGRVQNEGIVRNDLTPTTAVGRVSSRNEFSTTPTDGSNEEAFGQIANINQDISMTHEGPDDEQQEHHQGTDSIEMSNVASPQAGGAVLSRRIRKSVKRKI